MSAQYLAIKIRTAWLLCCFSVTTGLNAEDLLPAGNGPATGLAPVDSTRQQRKTPVTAAEGKNNPAALYSIAARKTDTRIKIDGDLSDPAWSQAGTASSFWEKFPGNTGKAARETEVRLLFDKDFIYISAVCYDPGKPVIPSLKRDRSFYEADAFAVLIDPFFKKTMAYYFSVTPYNTQSEDFLVNNIFEDPSLTWDNKWFSATRMYPDRWVAEMAIPFSILKFDEAQLSWGINFLRNDRVHNEVHSWTAMPLQLKPWDLGYTGTLTWSDALPHPGKNISLNPYFKAAAMSGGHTRPGIEPDWQAGVDVKTTIKNSVSLDLTVNPDFSQVEVDRQQTNLTRFNLFFPERRNFFVENNDIFSSYAGGYIQPFYSRSIGLTVAGTALPIYGGLKLSGHLSPGLRAGLLNVVTRGDAQNPVQHYAAFSVHQKLLKRSLLKGYFFDRESLNRDKPGSMGAFGRNAGLEFNYADVSGRWNGWSGFHHSMKPGIQSKRNVYHAGFSYNSRKFSTIIDFADAGTNYYADMGFISRYDYYDEKKDSSFRQGFRLHYGRFAYNVYPRKGRIINHKFENSNSYFTNPDRSPNELLNIFRYCMVFRNSSEIRVRADHQVVWLQAHTSFIVSANRRPLPPGRYQFVNATVYYRTDTRKKFGATGQYRMGQFYSGRLYSAIASLQYRVQPWGQFSLDLEYTRLHFPRPYGRGLLILVSPRAEINFSTKLSWTTFIQCNTQWNNLNINSRLQWRFRPLSDLFLVYTDNYYTDPLFRNKNRAVVLKLNYWLSK